MTNPIAVLEVEVQGLEAEIHINDLPVTRMTEDSSSEALSVQQYLVDGENVLEIVLSPGPTPATSRSAEHTISGVGRSARATITEYAPGLFPGDPSGKTLMAVEWSGGDRTDITAPVQVIDRRDLGTRHGQWSFQLADELTLDAATRVEVERFLQGLHASLAEKDAAPLVDASRPKIKDASVAYGLDFEGEVAGLDGFLKEEFEEESWEMLPLETDLLDLRLCASGRAIDCRRRDWAPALRSKGLDDKGDGQVEFDMRVGRIAGRLQVLR